MNSDEAFEVSNKRNAQIITQDESALDSYQYSGPADKIDDRDADDPLCVTSYVQDMYQHFRSKEAFTTASPEYMDNQQFIDRFKGTYSKTNQVNSREKMLEKLDIIEIDEVDNSSLNLRFPASKRSGDYPVIAKELSKSYGDHVVFKDADLSISRGEKVSFVGRNGEGKSTMIKAIMGEIDFEGECALGHNAKVGYFAQNQASLLDPDLTVFQTVDQIAKGDIRTQIKSILGGFMFRGEAVDKKVSFLSGGEKTRLAMVKLLLEPVNVLILDEPTNHLDLRSKDVLKEALKAFDGTLILVSHDRDFLQGLSQKVFEFKEKRVIEHFETIDEFLARNRVESLKQIDLLG